MEKELSVDEKIKLALKTINSSQVLFGNSMFQKIYPFTTENIKGYLDKVNFRGNSILTVGSSGDQVLSAVLYGCKKAQVVDICPFSKEYFFLKMAAILTLDREEFLEFFSIKDYLGKQAINKNVFNINVYRKIRDAIVDDETREFWNYLFKKYSGLFLRQKLFTINQDSPKNFVRKVNNYLTSDEEYNKLKTMVSDLVISFVIGNIFDIDLTEDQKFDHILFSNLITYNSPEDIVKLCKKYMPYLDDNGIIQIAYLYNGLSCAEAHRLLYQICSGIFEDISLISYDAAVKFMSFSESTFFDSSIIYKKVKK